MEKDLLLNLAEKNGFVNLKTRINKVDTDVSIQIGVLGEFNSGKSTLVNAMIGRKVLPAIDKPTTGSITEVIAKNELERIRYFQYDDASNLQKISALEFSDIAMGQKRGTAVLEVPERASSKKGIV